MLDDNGPGSSSTRSANSPERAIARGHAALHIGQALLPSTQPAINTLSGKRADLVMQLDEATKRLAASEDDELKDRWKWEQPDEGDMADLLKESGSRVLNIVEAVADWFRLREDPALAIDPKEFLLDLTERRHLQRLVSLIPSRLVLPRIEDLLLVSTGSVPSTDSTTTLESIRDLTSRLLSLIHIAPDAQRSDLYMFLSSPTILPFILLPPLLLGWSQSFPPATYSPIRRTFLEYIDSGLAPSESLSALGGLQTILTSKPGKERQTAKIVALEDEPVTYPEYARRTVKALMGRQMVRPGGVAGLLGNVFGIGQRKDGKAGDDVLELHKLDYVTKLLSIPVHGMEPKEYNNNIFEQLRLIVVPMDPITAQNTPRHHVQASAYVLTRLSVTSPLIKQSLKKTLHEPLFPRLEDLPYSASAQEPVVVTTPSRINSLVSLLLPLLTLNPPPPPFLDLALTPIVRPLFLLWQDLKQDKTADPLTRKEIEDVIGAWVRLMDVDLVERALWEVLQGGRGWKGIGFGGGMHDEEMVLFWGQSVAQEDDTGDDETGVAVLYGIPPKPTMDDLKTNVEPEQFDLATKLNDTHVTDRTKTTDVEEDYDVLPDLSGLQMYPDPELLVSTIERSARTDLMSRFFVKCLQAYQALSDDSDTNPERNLLLLQVIMRLSEKASTNLDKEVRHVLLFIEHALRTSPADPNGTADSDDGADSDDEDADDAEEATVEDVSKEDVPNLGLVETALNLLCTTLHGDPSISPATQPILKPIERHVQDLVKHRSADVRQAARSASLLLAVRKAAPANVSSPSTTDTAQRYQESLKLLQDPILAVRAHGLMILQSIVRAPDFDRALTPAIMDIFLSAIRDDDSFMYLNAIKGLSSLVDGLGRDVMTSITLAYVQDLGRMTDFKPDELDRRLRLGEALQQSVRRAGSALSGYIQPVVPRLLRVFPNTNLPTVIRSSSLSILATCADTEWRALLPWSNDLIGSCLDLLRLESVSQTQTQLKHTKPHDEADDDDRDDEEENDIQRNNNEPTQTNDSKHPALRRAALVFLGLMFDSVAKAIAENTGQITSQPEIRLDIKPSASNPPPAPVDAHLIQSARTVLNYIKHTDVDTLASHQAGEVLQILRQIPSTA